jgi:hypothetical protein
MKSDSKPSLYPKKKKKYTKALQITGVVFASLIILVTLAVLWFAKTVPSIQEIGAQQISQSTKIYDRTGTVLL